MYLLAPLCLLGCVLHCPDIHSLLYLSVRFFVFLRISPRLYENLREYPGNPVTLSHCWRYLSLRGNMWCLPRRASAKGVRTSMKQLDKKRTQKSLISLLCSFLTLNHVRSFSGSSLTNSVSFISGILGRKSNGNGLHGNRGVFKKTVTLSSYRYSKNFLIDGILSNSLRWTSSLSLAGR